MILDIPECMFWRMMGTVPQKHVFCGCVGPLCHTINSKLKLKFQQAYICCVSVIMWTRERMISMMLSVYYLEDSLCTTCHPSIYSMKYSNMVPRPYYIDSYNYHMTQQIAPIHVVVVLFGIYYAIPITPNSPPAEYNTRPLWSISY